LSGPEIDENPPALPDLPQEEVPFLRKFCGAIKKILFAKRLREEESKTRWEQQIALLQPTEREIFFVPEVNNIGGDYVNQNRQRLMSQFAKMPHAVALIADQPETDEAKDRVQGYFVRQEDLERAQGELDKDQQESVLWGVGWKHRPIFKATQVLPAQTDPKTVLDFDLADRLRGQIPLFPDSVSTDQIRGALIKSISQENTGFNNS
jgi:hypothetical protein